MQISSTSNWLRRWISPQIVVALLIVLVLAIIAFTYGSYGFTTDEVNGLRRARNIVSYFASSGQETAGIAEFQSRNFYGAMPDVLALLLTQLWPTLGYDSRHLVSALLGAAGITYTYKLGEYLGGRWVGVAAAGFLALTPMWFGYMFINPKDVPFAAALLAASYHGLRLLVDARRPSVATMIGLAVWTGALGSCKLTGVLLLGFAMQFLFGFWSLEHGRPGLARFAGRSTLAAALGLVGIAGFAFFFWPQLFVYTPEQVVKALLQFLNYDPWRGRVLLDGQFFDQDHVPRHYLITYLLITMPLLPLGLCLLGAGLSLWQRRFAVFGAVALPAVFLAIQAVTDAQVYTGFRQFLFTVPFICIGAGYSLVSLSRIARGTAIRVAVVGLFVVFAGWSGFTMVSLFPYQYSYYNALVGGTVGAQDRYYIDVWRSAEREALRRLSEQFPPGATPARVYTCGSALNFAEFPQFVGVRDASKPIDFAISLPRCAVAVPKSFEVVAEVRRGDVLFATVFRPPSAERKASGADEGPAQPD